MLSSLLIDRYCASHPFCGYSMSNVYFSSPLLLYQSVTCCLSLSLLYHIKALPSLNLIHQSSVSFTTSNCRPCNHSLFLCFCTDLLNPAQLIDVDQRLSQIADSLHIEWTRTSALRGIGVLPDSPGWVFGRMMERIREHIASVDGLTALKPQPLVYDTQQKERRWFRWLCYHMCCCCLCRPDMNTDTDPDEEGLLDFR